MARQDPVRNFRYRLEIDGIEQAGFSEVTIGDASNEPIEYREGNQGIDGGHLTAWKLSGLNKYANITCKWGITDSTELADWHNLVGDGATPLEDIRRNVLIYIQDEAGNDKATFRIVAAWPCKYDPTDLNGTGNEVAIDTLELCHEGIVRAA